MNSTRQVLPILLWRTVHTLNHTDLMEGLFGNRINLEIVVAVVQKILHFLEDDIIVENVENYFVQNAVIISSLFFNLITLFLYLSVTIA